MRFPLLILLAAAPAVRAGDTEFNRDVRPILSDACFACHGPDKNKRKAGLRLDDRAAAVEKGAIVPGKPDESELVARLKLKDDDDGKMPPAEAHKKLTPKQIETLTKWVAEGAVYQPHWAYIPPVKRPPPSAGNPIDSFIRAELAKRNIAPTPPADPRALARRLALDLTGLPPTPEQVAAFVQDPSPAAYEKLVDDLLASPHYGERMATPWLDAVRFADTVGYHGDQNQRIFPYRDYVIRAFNTNKPFDQFTREQLAGDLLPNPTTEQLVATGFNRLNMMTREGGAQPKEYVAKYQGDRVRTVSLAFLGSTLGCAECHDHKYDPFTAKDFYALSAFFADIRQWGVYADYGYTPNPDLKGWTNDHPFPPEIAVESEYLKARRDELAGQLVALARRKKPDDEALKDWLRELVEIASRLKDGWRTPIPTANGVVLGTGDRVVFDGKAEKGASHKIAVRTAGWVASVRLELLPDENHGGRISRDATPASVKLSLAKVAVDGKETKLPFYHASADKAEPQRWSGTAPVLDMVNGGWRTAANRQKQPHSSVWLLDQPVLLDIGERLIATVASDNVGCVRLSVSQLGADVGTDPAAKYLVGTGWDAAGFAEAKALVKEMAALNNGKAWTQITVAQKPTPTRLLPRGNWMDESGAVVEPAVPAFLGKLPASGRATRLDLANWIASKDNPLTGRAFVNRVWKQFFGTGLSAVLEDLGGQGEPPSHPELLDYLAVEFASDWDVKRLVRSIVLSDTYRQSSTGRPELREADPNNRLLAYMPPRRLEAEFVRDNALAVAGLLNRDIGGPSAKPYQPGGYYANLQFPDRNYVADGGRLQYRRGLYAHWQRTFLHPMLANFDAPSREECTANRTVANTPQQALTLLNDPTFVEAARVLAEKAMRAAKTDDERVGWLFERAVCRPATAAERALLVKLLEGRRKTFAGDADAAKKLVNTGIAPVPGDLPAAELAAWSEVGRAVLNLHETITRY